MCSSDLATEATNTALKGFFFSHQNSARRVCFLSTQVEHEATLETLRFLEREGAVVTLLPVNSEGELSIADFERALSSYEKSDAVLVSMLAANNETGVLFPWEKAADLTAKKDLTFHLDAVQSFGKDPDFTLRGRKILASLSAHKIGGPKGVGALVVPRGSKLVSLLHGGAQERKRRAGTDRKSTRLNSSH